MEYVIILILLIISTIVLHIIFGCKKSELEKFKNNKELEQISNKFPNNIDIGKDILKTLQNETTQIENSENKGTLYIAVTDKILIGQVETNYTRIQTIAHECLHSIQSKKIQMFNFIFSNIYIVSFFVISVLTACRVIQNYMLCTNILIILGFVYFIVRAYLEIDAMTKAKYLAEKYMKNYSKEHNNASEEEIDKLTQEYEKINKLGIPLSITYVYFSSISKIIVYLILSIVMYFIFK